MMPDKIYVNAIIELIVFVGEDVSDATNMYLKAMKPDGTTADWSATAYTQYGQTTYLKYITGASDLDQEGRYTLQSYYTKDGVSGRGETASFRVYANQQ